MKILESDSKTYIKGHGKLEKVMEKVMEFEELRIVCMSPVQHDCI